MSSRRFLLPAPSVLLVVLLAAGRLDATTPQVRLGERLFGETRFTSPSAEVAVSCRTCHHTGTLGDAAARSLVPPRGDGRNTTPRNSPALVDAIGVGETLLHFDAEFDRAETLVLETFTGRNFGWLPDERGAARKQSARVLREAGVAPENADDDAVLDAGARAVVAFLRTLRFSRDHEGRHDGSPYDAFLSANRLARAPLPTDTPPEYARRVAEQLAALRAPRWIDEPQRRLQSSGQAFRFGETELRGARIFFRSAVGVAQATGAGNCAECHVPPHFSDFKFHNTGASQDEYDAWHGAGAFARLEVPDLAARQNEPGRWLPPTARQPRAAGVFLASAAADAPGLTDLGVWNVYANPAFPAPQAALEKLLNPSGRLSPDEVLASALARFKTSGLRGLGDSAPYFHGGHVRTLEDTVIFYQRMSALAQAGKLRNPPPEFFAMRLGDEDVAPLAAFLRALNENYVEPVVGSARRAAGDSGTR